MAWMEKAKSVMAELKSEFRCYYEEKDTKLAEDTEGWMQLELRIVLTIDHQTLQDNTVTIRERDSMKQGADSIAAVSEKIQKSGFDDGVVEEDFSVDIY